MKTTAPGRFALCVAALASVALFCSCEDDDGFYMEYDTPCFSIAGDWTGSDDGEYVFSDMCLLDDDGRISGYVIWPDAGRRGISGYRTGTRLSIRVDGGDDWVLYYDDDYLRGTGRGPYDEYEICFRRR